ncbi:MAG: SDR family NAD(P)-dependent oxidoreductase [Candidatus Micrarchaeia archaeon]
MEIAGRKVLVTGGAGFVGSNVCERLLQEGAEVVAYDNLSSGSMKNVEALSSNKGFKFVKGDVLDFQLLDNTIKENGIDTVVHLAANPDIRKGLAQTDLDLNQGPVATRNVLEAMRKNDVETIMFSSSSAVYGIASVKPTPENYGPLRPISLYGASKLASEGLITAFSHVFGMHYYIFRFANVVGKGYSHGVIFDFVNKLRKNSKELEVLGNGKQKKSYTDVDDIVSAMLYVYSKNLSDEIFNIANDDRLTVSEIASIVAAKMNLSPNIKYTGTEEGWPGDIADTWLSNEKLKKAGFACKLNSGQAVGKTIDLLLAKE